MSIVGNKMNALIRGAIGVNQKTSPLEAYDPTRTLIELRKMNSNFQFTPDHEQLEEKPDIPVFICCAMMKGGFFHSIVENIQTRDAQYVFTVNRFHMWQSNQGRQSVPIPMAPKSRNPPTLSRLYTPPTTRPAAGLVKGQLLFIRSTEMNRLDNHFHNGVVFRRKKIPVQIPHKIQDYDKYGCNVQDEDVQGIGRAWMYVGKPDFWDESLNKGFGYSFSQCDVTDKAIRERNGNTYEVSPRRKWMNEPWYYFKAWEKNHTTK